MKFNELNLSQDILRAVDELGNMSAEEVGKFMQEKADLYFSEF